MQIMLLQNQKKRKDLSGYLTGPVFLDSHRPGLDKSGQPVDRSGQVWIWIFLSNLVYGGSQIFHFEQRWRNSASICKKKDGCLYSKESHNLGSNRSCWFNFQTRLFNFSWNLPKMALIKSKTIPFYENLFSFKNENKQTQTHSFWSFSPLRRGPGRAGPQFRHLVKIRTAWV